MTPTLKPVSVFENVFRTFLVNFANVSGLTVVNPVYRTFNSCWSSSAFKLKSRMVTSRSTKCIIRLHCISYAGNIIQGLNAPMLQRNSSKVTQCMGPVHVWRFQFRRQLTKRTNFIVASVHYLGGITGSTNTALVICIKKKQFTIQQFT